MPTPEPRHSRSVIRALGRIEEFKHDIRALADAAGAAPLWRPGAGLIRQCQHTLRLMEDLEARFDRKLVVTIIGPCGSGKSTLLNALSGQDDLSPAGIDRPTTRNVVVFCSRPEDADFIGGRLGAENAVVRSNRSAERLKHILLVDTPDTDSVEQQAHIPVVRGAVELSDILICVFNAENPKTRDHVDFFAPLIKFFDGESLVGVMNRCDRLDETELKEKILPDFKTYLQGAWEQPVSRIFCISARRHLARPEWDEGAGPRHEVDQFDALKELIFGPFNQGGIVVDRRIRNAEHLKDDVGMALMEALEPIRKSLQEALVSIRAAESSGLAESVSELKAADALPAYSINSLLYQKLAGRWMGPVGWLIALWARLLVLAAGVLTAFRDGHPLRRLRDRTRSFQPSDGSLSTEMNPAGDRGGDMALSNYRICLLRNWPAIAETLESCGFDASVRHMETVLPDGDLLKEQLMRRWLGSLDQAVEKTAGRLSGWLTQLLFNLLPVGILAHAGWTTAKGYVVGRWLPANYFIHAGLAILIVLFLSFFLFQVLARFVGSPDRIARLAEKGTRHRIEDLQPLTGGPLIGQVTAVLALVPEQSNSDGAGGEV